MLLELTIWFITSLIPDVSAVPLLLSIEEGHISLPQVLTAVALVLMLAALLLALRSRRLAEQARSAGLEPGQAETIAPDAVRRAPVADGTVMIIGATGRSLSGTGSRLAAMLGRCTSAKIMLLDPREQGALVRSQSVPDPEITVERIRGEVGNSIAFLRALREAGIPVLLKLYPDVPLFKLVITNSTARLQHYHPSLNVRLMPEFVFRDSGRHGGLYLPLYRYFLSRWNDPDIPEYDFNADELVYHDQLGAEVLREPFTVRMPGASGAEPGLKAEQSYVFRS